MLSVVTIVSLLQQTEGNDARDTSTRICPRSVRGFGYSVHSKVGLRRGNDTSTSQWRTIFEQREVDTDYKFKTYRKFHISLSEGGIVRNNFSVTY